MEDMERTSPIQEARARVASRYPHTYHQNAILGGDWDSGRLVQDALEEVISERRDALKEEGTIQDDE